VQQQAIRAAASTIGDAAHTATTATNMVARKFFMSVTP
jgi:hypothetical protein